AIILFALALIAFFFALYKIFKASRNPNSIFAKNATIEERLKPSFAEDAWRERLFVDKNGLPDDIAASRALRISVSLHAILISHGLIIGDILYRIFTEHQYNENPVPFWIGGLITFSFISAVLFLKSKDPRKIFAKIFAYIALIQLVKIGVHYFN
ncbi:MAG: hypothetical protein K2Q18_08475, partial [Bdellovibrionales bacterium]|nr:hypothetical protein [Bdellovibrionales bacterium]